jgi:nucleoid-associated protein YgaU
MALRRQPTCGQAGLLCSNDFRRASVLAHLNNAITAKGETMGLISFLKNAGEKLFNRGEQAQAEGAAAPTPEQVQQQEKNAEIAILNYIASQNLPVDGVTVRYESPTGTVTVSGMAPDQQTREKIILCCGNVEGVSQVNDQMTVAQTQEQESQFYTVQSGDTLSKISKQFYGDANKYMVIFEANKPMLTHPDKIYPGQVLRIPQGA